MCSVDGCGKKHLALGFCAGHRYRFVTFGHPTVGGPPPRVKNAGKACSVDGCGEPAKRNLLCRTHDQIRQRHGSPSHDTSPKGWINVQGYAVVSVDNVRKLAHRHVSEMHLSRPLETHENVHHRNGDKLDNSVGPCLSSGRCECSERHNLELWSKKQPAGQRVQDKVRWAKEIVDLYSTLSDIEFSLSILGLRLAVPASVAPLAGGWINESGYRATRVGGKTVLEHRVVAESFIGRKLHDNENVHHRNGERAENTIGPCFDKHECACPERHNLELWSTSQPIGQRVCDKLSWAHEILALYVKREDLIKYYNEVLAKYGNCESKQTSPQ